jgi:hypothetical protein
MATTLIGSYQFWVTSGGNKLSGFNIVESRNAGVLVPCLSSQEIWKALQIIDESYNEMALNSKKISKDFDQSVFLKSAIEYIV